MSRSRRPLGVLFVLGGVVVLLVAVGSAGAAALLGSSSATAPSATFAAGDTVTAPRGDAIAGPLVVYGSRAEVEGSTTLALGCDVVSPGGSDRVVTSTSGDLAVRLDGSTLVPLVQAQGAEPGDAVTCAGDGAAVFEPLAVGFAPVPETARAVAIGLAVLAVVVGVVFLLVGVRVLRSR